MSIFSDFFKKEAPLLGLQGSGGGLGFLAGRGGGVTLWEGSYATGGIISDYVDDGGTHYRAHIFVSPGTFSVSDASLSSLQYLVVGGGGSGGASGGSGNAGAGGGGAGGLRTNVPGVARADSTPLTANPYPVTPGSYTVSIGRGGFRRYRHHDGDDGGNTNFYRNGTSMPNALYIRGTGGGGGGKENPNSAGRPGGSGGAGGRNSAGGSGDNTNDPNHTRPQGTPGYGPGGGGQSGGGGGAGEAGQAFNPPRGGRGGDGVQVAIAGPATNFTGVGALNPGTGQYQWFAGGGGGGGISPTPQPSVTRGGYGGGGQGGEASPSQANNTWGHEVGEGQNSTGGGGGGGSAGPTSYGNLFRSGEGGTGIVIVRYEVPGIGGLAKATGGAISFYNGKTIHTFTNPGTFIASESLSCEYVCIGGGGGGGNSENGGTHGGGGGGAGTYRTGTGLTVPAATHQIEVGYGGDRGIDAIGGQSTENQGHGNPGGVSSIGSLITSPGGGGGGNGLTPGDGGGRPGGSGGGGGYAGGAGSGTGTGASFPGAIGATPPAGWGHPGPNGYGSGGGGAGGGGQPLGPGGHAIQLPATFRDPASTIGAPGPTSRFTGTDSSGKFWVAGGGAGGNGGNDTGGGPSGPHGGAGDASAPADDALSGTGSGGGGSGTGAGSGGKGGSGLVLISYPT